MLTISMRKGKTRTNISIVIPVKNEVASIEQLYKEICSVCKVNKYNYEIIFVDDGSTDGTFEKIEKLSKLDRHCKGLKLRDCFGKSIALNAGFSVAKYEIVISMDGDLQDNPIEIPNFIKKINEGYDLVNGWKKKRLDPISKTLPSKFINFAVGFLTGIHLHDINCGFKAYKAEVIKNLNIYGDLYRFIPVLVKKRGYKITEIPVAHRARKYGKSKYGWKRFISGIFDLITVFFLARFLRRPAHFFGFFGLSSLGMGTLICMYIAYLRIVFGGIQYRYPLLFLGVLLIIVGIQLMTTGLVSEMIIFFQKKEDVREYIFKKNSLIFFN